jgi:AraC-like DNA-binding protein
LLDLDQATEAILLAVVGGNLKRGSNETVHVHYRKLEAIGSSSVLAIGNIDWRVERATRIIDAELTSPRLQPSKLSSRLGVSRSRLYRLFEPYGGVARYIQKRGLLRIFEALGDPEIRETIAALSAGYGFDDPSNFCRAFRREFGRSAGDVRAPALADMALSSGSAQGRHAP